MAFQFLVVTGTPSSGLESERMGALQLAQVATVAEHDLGVEGKRSGQCRPEFAARTGAPHDEGPAAPIFTISNRRSACATRLGRNVRWPPTLAPRSSTTSAMGGMSENGQLSPSGSLASVAAASA